MVIGRVKNKVDEMGTNHGTLAQILSEIQVIKSELNSIKSVLSAIQSEENQETSMLYSQSQNSIFQRPVTDLSNRFGQILNKLYSNKVAIGVKVDTIINSITSLEANISSYNDIPDGFNLEFSLNDLFSQYQQLENLIREDVKFEGSFIKEEACGIEYFKLIQRVPSKLERLGNPDLQREVIGIISEIFEHDFHTKTLDENNLTEFRNLFKALEELIEIISFRNLTNYKSEEEIKEDFKIIQREIMLEFLKNNKDYNQPNSYLNVYKIVNKNSGKNFKDNGDAKNMWNYLRAINKINKDIEMITSSKSNIKNEGFANSFVNFLNSNKAKINDFSKAHSFVGDKLIGFYDVLVKFEENNFDLIRDLTTNFSSIFEEVIFDKHEKNPKICFNKIIRKIFISDLEKKFGGTVSSENINKLNIHLDSKNFLDNISAILREFSERKNNQRMDHTT